MGRGRARQPRPRAGPVSGRLVESCRLAFREIGFQFRDLRREFASRLLESSADLHDVQLFLGHANISQTSTYVRSTPVRLASALKKMEAGFTHGLHTAEKTGSSKDERTAEESTVTH